VVRRRIRAAGLGGLIGLTLAACTGSGQPAPTDPGTGTVAVDGVRVTPQVWQFTGVGESTVLSATVVPIDATDRGVVWESSDTLVATVNPGGVVTARSAGFGVIITARTRDGNFQSSANVSVVTAFTTP
jgi:uncharacterized protein YjdB